MIWLLFTILIAAIFSWTISTYQANKISKLKQELVDQKAVFLNESYAQIRIYEDKISKLEEELKRRGFRAKI